MAAKRSYLGPLSFSLDAAFADETLYEFRNPSPEESVVVVLEPIRHPEGDPAARRVQASAEELKRVYPTAQIGPPVTVPTGVGPAVMLHAILPGNLAAHVAAVHLGDRLLYVTGASDAAGLAVFPRIVESIQLQEPPEASDPAMVWRGAGPIRLLIPQGWSEPSAASLALGSARLELRSGEAASSEEAPEDYAVLGPGESLVLNSENVATEINAQGLRASTRLRVYTISDPQGRSTDSIATRVTTLTPASASDAPPVVRALGMSRSKESAAFAAAWSELLASMTLAGLRSPISREPNPA